jgi:hypothetical protein
MIYGYARVSTDGQTLDAHIAALKTAGAEKVYSEKPRWSERPGALRPPSLRGGDRAAYFGHREYRGGVGVHPQWRCLEPAG